MRVKTLLIVAMLGGSPEVRADDVSSARYQALLAEYQSGLPGYSKASEGAKTADERKAVIATYPGYVLAPRFLDFARDHPREPEAFAALVWVVAQGRTIPEGARALESLASDHAGNPRIAEVFSRIEFNPLPEAERLFRAVIDRGSGPETRGPACLSMARNFQRRADVIRSGSDYPPKRWARLGELYGPEVVQTRLQGDPAPLLAEAVALYERTARDFAAVPSRNGPLGELAARDLHELRHLGIGQVAPEVQGLDADGVAFRLGDYRGKIVLLAFGGEWCGPCVAAVPHERALAAALVGKPFVVLGVNSDQPEARKAQKRSSIRSWSDGGFDGPIDTLWNISAWPTFYILDGAGVIRFKCQAHDAGAIEQVLERLLKEQGHDVRLQGIAPLDEPA